LSVNIRNRLKGPIRTAGLAAANLCGFRLVQISFPHRIGHLAVESDCLIKESILDRGTVGNLLLVQDPVDVIPGRAGFANQVLANYLKRYFYVVKNRLLARFLNGVFRSSSLVVETAPYAVAIYESARSYEIYSRWGTRPAIFQLTARDRQAGQDILKQMGLPPNAWFVCLHAREGGYAAYDEHLHSYRNVDIEDYAPAIEEITNRGGWCIRMGDPTMTPKKPQKQVIDYAVSEFRSDRMDVFLAATCRFMLGCASGLAHLVTMFGRPSVMVNMAPLSGAYSSGVKDLAIPQRLRAADGRILSFEEIMSSDIANLRATAEFESRGLQLIRATPDEIRELVVEMMDRLDGAVDYGADDEARQERFRKLFREGHYAYKAGSRIGREFLRRYF